MDKLEKFDRLKCELIKTILNKKEEDLDKPYLRSSAGSFTRRELAREIELETEVGMRQIEMIMDLAIDLMVRNKG